LPINFAVANGTVTAKNVGYKLDCTDGNPLTGETGVFGEPVSIDGKGHFTIVDTQTGNTIPGQFGGTSAKPTIAGTFSWKVVQSPTVTCTSGAVSYTATGQGKAGPPPPVAGKSVNVSVASGTVTCRRGAASFAKVTTSTQFAVGEECDTSKGALVLTSAGPAGTTQTGLFSGGRFIVTQRSGAIPVTVLTLSGPLLPCTDCRTPSTAGSSRKRERHVSGSARGHFETKGKYATASVKGTKWETQDTPGATVVRVTSGTVIVTDSVTRKHVTVGPRESYVAKAKGK
jgi:hypothetical protein